MNSRVRAVLAGIVESGVDVHRCAAARALGLVGGPGATAVLGKALRDEDPDVRTDAAQALGDLGDPEAAHLLMENLVGDPDPDVKKAALEALIAFGHSPVVPLLRKLVVSRTDDIVWDEDEFYTDEWDSWLDLQMMAIRGLARFGTEDAAQDILTAMGDDFGQDVSEIGVSALASMGETGAEALEQLFPISDSRLQRRIAAALIQTQNPAARTRIDMLLAASSARVREIAVRGPVAIDPRLVPMFGDSSAAVRAAVVRHAGKHHRDATGALIGDPDATVRVEVFRVIAGDPTSYQDEKLVAAVKKAISGDPKAAKQAALALIALVGTDALKGLSHTMTNTKVPQEFRVGAVEALVKAGPASAPHLLKAVGDDNRQMRLAAMTALAGLAADDPVWPNAAGDGLIAALAGKLVEAPQEPPEEEGGTEETPAQPDAAAAEEEREIDETTPLAAVSLDPDTSTLGKMLSGATGAQAQEAPVAEPEPVESSEQDQRFLELSKQRRLSRRKMSLESDVAPHLDVRRFAASVLGVVPKPEITDELIAVLETGDGMLRDAALVSISQHGDTLGVLPQSAFAPLKGQFTAATETETRVLALRALAKVAGSRDVLGAAVNDSDPLVRVEAVRGLGHQGFAGADVEAALNDGYVGVGLAAARSLARNRGAEVVDALIEFAFRHDGTYRRDIGQLLGTYAGEAGIERLIDLLQDDAHLRERLVVIEALAEAINCHSKTNDLKVA